MKVVNHDKCLGQMTFKEIQGSPQHAAMSMNRVWLDFSSMKRGDLLALIEAVEAQRTFVKKHLNDNCRNYYHLPAKSANNDLTMRILFLSKQDMEDFIVWAKMALPNENIADEPNPS